MSNLFNGIPVDLPQEFFETLVQSEHVHIERIVSRGHTTKGGEWFDQDQGEFVLLLRGGARLEYLEGPAVTLHPGDWLVIPANCKHRVSWTDNEQDSIWLAVHYPG